jgi:hypothetical protein
VRAVEGIPPRAHLYIALTAIGLAIGASVAMVMPSLRPVVAVQSIPVLYAPKDQSRAPHTVGATAVYFEWEE